MMKHATHSAAREMKLLSPRAIDHRPHKVQQHRYERRKIKQYYKVHSWTEDDEG